LEFGLEGFPCKLLRRPLGLLFWLGELFALGLWLVIPHTFFPFNSPIFPLLLSPTNNGLLVLLFEWVSSHAKKGFTKTSCKSSPSLKLSVPSLGIGWSPKILQI